MIYFTSICFYSPELFWFLLFYGASKTLGFNEVDYAVNRSFYNESADPFTSGLLSFRTSLFCLLQLRQHINYSKAFDQTREHD
jgi:hypothetical protein